MHLRIRPRERGKGFSFVDAVKGGTIPNQFIPACEKGIREQMDKGVISGNQVVDTEVEVYFGKDHPVDSSEQAFKTAAATAFRKAFEQARPALLEPIVTIDVSVPAEKFGDISADLSTRRGHITGMDSLAGNQQVIRAEVPLAEVLTYASSTQEHDRRPGLIHHGLQVLRPCARPTSSSKSSRSTRRAGPASKRNKSDLDLTKRARRSDLRQWAAPFVLPFACPPPFTKYDPCGRLAVLAQVQPERLLFGRDPQRDNPVRDLVQDPRTPERKHRDDHKRQQVKKEQSRTSPRSVRRPFANTPVSTIPVIPPTP